jgi:superfamily II DNA/RNA helicase
MGFKVAINALIEALPSDRQTLLFSATQTRYLCIKIFLPKSFKIPTFFTLK